MRQESRDSETSWVFLTVVLVGRPERGHPPVSTAAVRSGLSALHKPNVPFALYKIILETPWISSR